MKAIRVGVGASYKRPYGEEDLNYNGLGDVNFLLKDRDLYTNRDYDFHLSGELEYIIPVSERSQKNTLENAFQAGLKARKGLLDWRSVGLSTEVGRYFYEYETSDIEGRRYNSPYSWSNALSLTFKLVESLKSSISAGYKNAIDYADNHKSSTSLGVGLNADWQALRSLTLSAGVRSSQGGRGDGGGDSGGGSGGDSGGDSEEGGSGSSRSRPSRKLFDASTTSLSFGASYRF